MKVTIVKKITTDGNLCRKSADVWERLQKERLLGYIDRIIFAHETKPNSEGLILAAKHQVERAPFFIVQQDDNSTQVYTSYARFLSEALDRQVAEKEEIAEIMASSADLDFI
ncbi:conserved hypothetical protein [Hyella patelloides LEGE 07179]|uniref:Uncharacterized protein n=1 Tax=Hyella patelloides LEGE 07179 TaxID=945734 RepID=A0A563VQA2_9CYAN|nr:hypothetical protein [Hyella patelloides]VEP13545.1 conserved hypothetical protein [Hyella patelloides LEGE 07179]